MGKGPGPGPQLALSEAAAEDGVKYLSVYAFSEENWNRPKEEVMALMELMMRAMKNELGTFLDNDIRFMVLGNRARLSDGLNKTIDEMMAATAGNSRTTLILFVSYSGKWDLLQAMKKAQKELSPEEFQAMELPELDRFLVTAGIPDPDLLIRTSGELRISNYMLWQCAYTEFYFTDVLWPDFDEAEFQKALAAFGSRQRRFGEVKP